jgi:dihydroflavonol-4-reductase
MIMNLILLILIMKFKQIHLIKSMAKILLTGATGFVGSHIAQYLSKQNHEVICLIRDASKIRWIKELPLRICQGSLYDSQTYRNLLSESEYVLHVAGVTKAKKMDDYFLGNFETTKRLLETTKDMAKRLKKFLLVSSQAAVGPSPSDQPIDESFPCQPVSSYGKSKLMAEQITLDYKEIFPITIIRPPAVYGPRDTDVYLIFKYISKGINLRVGEVDQLVSIVYVEDLVKGIVEAAYSPKTSGKIYFLCEDTCYRWSQVARLSGEILNKKYLTIKLPYIIAYTLAFTIENTLSWTNKTTILSREKMREIKHPYWVISPQRAKRDFGYQTGYPLSDGIRHTLKWYKENGWI